MKKAIVALFVLSLLVPGFGLARLCADEVNPEAASLAQEFTQKAMNAFESADNPQVDSVAVGDKVDEYAKKFAAILLEAGVDAKTAGSIMQEASVWYGQSLEALFNANSYNSVIQEYSDKIAGLFSRHNLSMDTQSKIVDMTSDNLEFLNNLFNPMEDVED